MIKIDVTPWLENFDWAYADDDEDIIWTTDKDIATYQVIHHYCSSL